MSIAKQVAELQRELPEGVALVAVSKTYPSEVVMEAYQAGLRVFGENRPQEMKAKYEALPRDIGWHMIGHLQTNKVKYIAPFVELIHSVDSERLAQTIDREALKNGRVIDVLLEVFVASEESKHGWEPRELERWAASGAWRELRNVRFRGLMGMATFTDDDALIRSEFSALRDIFLRLRDDVFGSEFDTLSMGMSSDWQIAAECGANMVRIGSRIFGNRGRE